ncbi:MAG: DUF4399 domain-containing protein [Gammaproteobacteria bacterium]|nr:DUF4399 domain-containing protein [Gammaproteobacteria bacterium]NND39167.1 DUF4399 domain-containing protein [Pseudomonadales bacterium]MBT8150431.1 DUF4399 domain-containing protein [Gammaproteobacteria bacterium]NNL11829.1 DUF4399 domain-containing protein [Pseudomonadales bacterium]NNM12492.1 DUF4399 domain-containing protein [Pseudomonadales bacterium]
MSTCFFKGTFGATFKTTVQKLLATVLITLLPLACSKAGEGAPGSAQLSSTAPAAASVYLISPVNGERVPTTFKVKFGLSGMGVAPAGVPSNNTGHHHLLIDIEQLPPLDKPLPASDKLRHFGGGQTEVLLTLEPGEHSLQLLLGNHLHVPHQPPVLSKKIHITVE